MTCSHCFIHPAAIFSSHTKTASNSKLTSIHPHNSSHSSSFTPPFHTRRRHRRPQRHSLTHSPSRQAVNCASSARPFPLPSSSPSPGQESSENSEDSKPLPNKWSVAIAASTIHALHATAVYTVPATLIHPLRNSLNLSISAATRPLLLFRILHTFLLFPSSFIIARIGPQRSLRYAIVAAAFLAPLLSLATSLPQLMLLQAFFAITKLFAGLSPLLLLTVSAFQGSKGVGTATAVVLSGYSFAGFLAPAVVGALSEWVGWRLASFIMSLVFGFIAVPVTFMFMRDRPLPSPPVPTKTDTNKDGKKRLFTKEYTAVFASVAAFSFSMHIVIDHLVLYLTDEVNMPFHHATRYLSLFNLISLISKLSSGPMSDKFDKSLLIIIYGILGIVSSFVLLNVKLSPMTFSTSLNMVRIVVFIILYAASYSGIFSTTSAILPEMGVDRMGLRSNLNLTAFFGAGSVGSFLTSRCRSLTGSYRWPFIVWNALSFMVVVGCGVWLRRVRSMEAEKAKAE